MPPTPTRLLCVLACLALLLSGCSALQNGPPSTPTLIQPSPTPAPTVTLRPSPTPETVGGTLTIWHTWTEGERAAWTQILAGFRQQHPEVLFDVLYVPVQDLVSQYTAEAEAGRGPAILLGPAELGPTLYDAGLIQDLNGWVTQERLDTLNLPALGAGRYNGAQIGVPYAIQGVVLFRNKEIVTLSPATWEDLETLAETSTQGEVIGAYLDRSFYFSGAHLVGLGGQLMTEDGQPAFNDPKGVEWIELLQKFDAAGPPNFFTDEDLDRFKAGTVGWIIDGTWNMLPLAAAIGPENLAIDPWPTYADGQLSGFVTAENLFVNSDTRLVNALTLRTFIDYFLSEGSQTLLAEVGRIPAASGVTLSDTATGPLLAQAMTALAGGTTYPVGPEVTNFNLELDLALRGVFENGVPPAQALDQAAAAITAAGQAAPTATP